MIITIDGPAGSGKSTAARKLAAALEIPYLDTGAMYRAVTLKALQTGTSFDDPGALVKLAESTDVQLDCGPTHVRVIMDSRDVSEALRSMRVNEHTNAVARVQGVREVLVDKQRRIARRLGSVVAEGRDQGSVVFPDAEVKFVLDATDTRRAERRYHELLADGEDAEFDQVLENIRQRDNNDQSQWAPLLAPGRAVQIDTTNLTIAQVVDRMRHEIQRRQP